MSKPTVGFIGLGSQGGPMARRSAEAGDPPVLWAHRPETLASYSAAPAQFSATLPDNPGAAALARAADILFTELQETR